MNLSIPGIDTEKAIKNSGSEEVFTELLGDVYKLIDEKSDLGEIYLKENDLKNFTIVVHSLKTACRMIGAMDLGEDFFTLEKLGKENRTEQIEALAPAIFQSFRALKPYLEPFATQNTCDKKDFDKACVSELLNKLYTAMDDFDLDIAEGTIHELLTYHCDNALSNQFQSLERLVSNLDYEEAKVLSKQIQNKL